MHHLQTIDVEITEENTTRFPYSRFIGSITMITDWKGGLLIKTGSTLRSICMTSRGKILVTAGRRQESSCDNNGRKAVGWNLHVNKQDLCPLTNCADGSVPDIWGSTVF